MKAIKVVLIVLFPLARVCNSCLFSKLYNEAEARVANTHQRIIMFFYTIIMLAHSFYLNGLFVLGGSCGKEQIYEEIL